MREEGAYDTIRRMQTYFAYLGSGAALLFLELFVPRGFAGIAGAVLCLLASWTAAQRFEGAVALGFAVLALVVAGGLFCLGSRFGSRSKPRKAPDTEEKGRGS